MGRGRDVAKHTKMLRPTPQQRFINVKMPIALSLRNTGKDNKTQSQKPEQ